MSDLAIAGLALADVNAGQTGDSIIQPGTCDGGNNPADTITLLESWVPIDFAPGANNFVDCATAWCWPDRVRRDFIYRSEGKWAYFAVSSNSVVAAIGLSVGKSGRTT